MSRYHYSSINSKLSNSPSPTVQAFVIFFSGRLQMHKCKKGQKIYTITLTHPVGLSSSRLIMNGGWLWNSYKRNKFLRAKASRDILKFRVSKMAFKRVFKTYFPPQTPCYFVRIQARLGTMPSKCPRHSTFHRSRSKPV